MKRDFWFVTSRESRGHAILLAAISLVFATFLLVSTSGRLDRFGYLKGGDVVNVYAIGSMAWKWDPRLLYDGDSLHELQVSLVPESAATYYPPVYPPQAAVPFAPFAMLPFGLGACTDEWRPSLTAIVENR